MSPLVVKSHLSGDVIRHRPAVTDNTLLCYYGIEWNQKVFSYWISSLFTCGEATQKVALRSQKTFEGHR